MTGERPVVSVITANHNGAPHLPAAIRSVQDQTLGALELIVVDDASTDRSVAVVEAAAALDPRIVLLVQPRNLGPAAARNRGLAAARGRWIAIFDADDLMAPERLARLTSRGEADSADIVADNLLAFHTKVEGARPFLDARAFAAPRWIGLAELIASSRMYARRPGLGYLKPVIRASALAAAGVRYDEGLRIGEDYDLLLRLLAKGLKLRLEPAAGYFYRRHAASTSHVLGREHLQAMLAAEARFEAEFPNLPGRVRRAQRARRRSLEAALAYDAVVARLKGGDLAGALGTALAAPAAWPLLRLPITARLSRLAGQLAPPSHPRRQTA